MLVCLYAKAKVTADPWANTGQISVVTGYGPYYNAAETLQGLERRKLIEHQDLRGKRTPRIVYRLTDVSKDFVAGLLA
jgi:hypothetical protein